MTALKVLVVDYAACAAAGAVQSPCLQRQGQMTALALVDDLRALPDVALATLTCLDGHTPFAVGFDTAVRAADAVWLLAPATGGVLERLSRQVLRRGRILLGSAPQALRLAARRSRAAHALAGAGIATVPTCPPRQALAAGGAWLVRLDDGVGWADTRLFASAAAALAWIQAHTSAAARPAPAAAAMQSGPPWRPPRPRAWPPATPARTPYVLQPYIPGKLGSLCVLCRDGAAQLLACNELRVAVRDEQFYFLGTTVNSLADADGALARLAHAVAAAMPGLWGYVGVDFVLAERDAVVLELSAQLGPWYPGLHASLGCNPAALALDLLRPDAARTQRRGKPLAVSVDVAAFGAL